MNRFIYLILIIFFSFTNKSFSNELDKVSACAGVVMGDGASELRDRQDIDNFNDAFKLAINAFYGEGLSKQRSKEDIIIAENIIALNLEKIYLQPEWTSEVYEEVIRCYRMLGLKVLEKSDNIKNNSEMIKQYIKKYKARFKRFINAG
tara:strand:+ start:138 stop:581 length:444 start_codon:yes stop_codon:yes gene_type:complete